MTNTRGLHDSSSDAALASATTTRRGLSVLKPWIPSEGISSAQAAGIARTCVATMRGWASLHGIGARVGGKILISHPALLMLLERDRETLEKYRAGDRTDARVVGYFSRCGIDLLAVLSSTQEG
jgi:hypothetical protein